MSEWTTFGEFIKEHDRIFELHRLIKNAHRTGMSLEQLHPLAQELADLTRRYAATEDSDAN